MKKKLFILFFIVCINSLHAFDNTRFFWSLGDIGINFDNTENNIKMFPSLNAGTINWITDYGLGWGFHVFTIESGTDWTQALILPVELSYSPFGDNSKRLFLTLYGRGGWALNYGSDINGTLFDRSGFFGAAGLRAAWIPQLGEHWSVFTGAFIEYTSKNEIRMGISLDTSVIIVLTAIVLGIALSDNDEEEEY